MKIYLGTANFLKRYGYKDSQLSRLRIKKILDFFYKKKFNLIDTALKYDNFLRYNEFFKLKNFKISTKINVKKKSSSTHKYFEHIENRILEKLKKNNIKKFDNLFIHNFDSLKKDEIIISHKYLKKMKNKGLFNKLGVSIYDISSLKKIKYLKSLKIVQAPINCADQRFLSKNVLLYLKKRKISLQARSIFLQGVLLDDLKKLRNKKFIDKKFLLSFNKWCEINKISKLYGCLNFIKSQPIIKEIVLGVESVEQLKEIIKSMKQKKTIDYPKDLLSKKSEFIDPRKW